MTGDPSAALRPPSFDGWIPRDLIADHARSRPRALACLDLRSGERVTYEALDRLVGRCAAVLTERLGAPVGERVACLARNGLDLVLLHYACDRIGAIFVPLNWRLSAHEISGLVGDAEPRLIFHEAEFAAAIPQRPGLEAVEIGPGANALRQVMSRVEPMATQPLSPHAPWTLLYTSGTTGRPKGVVVTRTGAFWGSFNLSVLAGIGPDSVLLCDPPMFHTVGLFGIARTALQTGATLAISDRFAPEATLRRLGDPDLRVTHYFGVPQIGERLLDEPGFATTDLSRLKAVIMGGSPLPASVAERFAERGVPVINGFGMTETCSVMHMPLDLARIRERPSHVGFPGPTVEARIVGPEGEDAAPGEVGELWLRGASITPGYWNQPEATAAAFSGDWFRTGDAARRDPDGMYAIVDRWKDMYISGGENVYPAEVEAVISGLSGVAEAAVVGVPHPRWGEGGCAFVVRGPGATLAEQDVLDHCGPRLARFKQPAFVQFCESLPRTASGKVRKAELRALFVGLAAKT